MNNENLDTSRQKQLQESLGLKKSPISVRDDEWNLPYIKLIETLRDRYIIALKRFNQQIPGYIESAKRGGIPKHWPHDVKTRRDYVHAILKALNNKIRQLTIDN